jgi:hypothetical protein
MFTRFSASPIRRPCREAPHEQTRLMPRHLDEAGQMESPTAAPQSSTRKRYPLQSPHTVHGRILTPPCVVYRWSSFEPAVPCAVSSVNTPILCILQWLFFPFLEGVNRSCSSYLSILYLLWFYRCDPLQEGGQSLVPARSLFVLIPCCPQSSAPARSLFC